MSLIRRGTNENTNGLLRQFFPKSTSFAGISDDDLQLIVDMINNRLRKRLNYLTPFEVLKKFSRNCVVLVLAFYHQIMLLTSKQCMSFFCTKNVRLSNDKESPEICMISGVILFGKSFGNLCSGKGRFAEKLNGSDLK